MSPASALSGRLTDFIVAGALREDCVWENEIWLQGDVLVPRTIILRRTFEWERPQRPCGGRSA